MVVCKQHRKKDVNEENLNRNIFNTTECVDNNFLSLPFEPFVKMVPVILSSSTAFLLDAPLILFLL